MILNIIQHNLNTQKIHSAVQLKQFKKIKIQMIFFLLKMIKTEILTKQYLNNQEEERRSIHSRKNFPLQEISATMVKVSRAWL